MANGGIIGPLNPVTGTSNIGSGVNASYGDLKLFCQNIVNNSKPGSAKGIWSMNDVYTNKKNNNWISTYTDGEPTVGGTQTINSVGLGSYDFVRKTGGTLSSFNYSDYFTGTNDSRSSAIIFDGNVTVDAGVTIIPRNRKLFTCIYINGNLVLNGDIEMTLRGANHSSGSGSNISSGAIKIAPGPFSPSVTDPNVPSSGGSGGGAQSGSGSGIQGGTGSNGGTGGGSSGGVANNGNNVSAAGTPGSSFSGGPSGTWASFGAPPFGPANLRPAEPNGGRGALSGRSGQPPTFSGAYYYSGQGNSQTSDVAESVSSPDQQPYWGRANPGPRSPGVSMGFGSAAQPSAYSPTGGIYGNPSSLGNFYGGTGGVLILMVSGTLSGSGKIRADGYYGTGGQGGVFNRAAGGAGSVTVICGNNSSSITPTAQCGPSQGPYGEKPGGAGTARILTGTL